MWKRIGEAVFLLLPSVTSAAGLSVTAAVDRAEVGLGETLVLTVSVQGEDIRDVPSPELPDLLDFDVLGRSSSQRTSIQLINGQMTHQQTIDFAYTLSPRKLGGASIGPVKLEYQGKNYETRAIEVNVVQGSTQQPGQPRPRSPLPEAEVSVGDDLKLVAWVDRKDVYWGEGVAVEFALYTRVSIGDVNLVEPPTFKGFWVRSVYDAKKLDFQRKTFEGRTFDACVLKKSVLFPVSSGELEIGEMELKVGVVQRSRDFFDLFGRTKTVRVSSQPIKINVRPLPTEERPENFTGGVGQFTIKATLDRTSSEAAEPVTLTIRVDGEGNIPFIEKLVVPRIAGVKVLDPEIGENVRAVGDRVKGYKEFRYPVIPQTDGEHLIPSIAISYFDPKDETYRMLKTAELGFTASQTAAATEFVPTSGLKVLGDDIRHIKPDMPRLESQRFTPQGWLVLFYIGSFGVIGVSLLLQRHRARLLTDRAYARRLRSGRMAKRRLKQAEGFLKSGDEQEFYSALSKTILGYLGDRYDLDVHAMRKDELREGLMKKKVRKSVIDEISALLDQCDTACFSPNLGLSEKPERLLSKTKEVVSEL